MHACMHACIIIVINCNFMLKLLQYCNYIIIAVQIELNNVVVVNSKLFYKI